MAQVSNPEIQPKFQLIALEIKGSIFILPPCSDHRYPLNALVMGGGTKEKIKHLSIHGNASVLFVKIRKVKAKNIYLFPVLQHFFSCFCFLNGIKRKPFRARFSRTDFDNSDM